MNDVAHLVAIVPYTAEGSVGGYLDSKTLCGLRPLRDVPLYITVSTYEHYYDNEVVSHGSRGYGDCCDICVMLYMAQEEDS